VLAQSSEEEYTYYDGVVAHFLANAMPDLVRPRRPRPKIRALYGRHNLATLHACAQAALIAADHPANAALFAALRPPAHGVLFDFNVLLE
jgi:hypothetical protein